MKRAALLAFTLAACSGRGAPDEADLRTALAAANNRGAREAVLLACKQSPERPGYVCDYRAPACNRFTGTCGEARPFTGRFLYASERWQLVEDLTPRAQPDPVTQPLPGVTLATPTPTVPLTTPADPDAYPTAPPAAPAPATSAPPPEEDESALRPRDLERVAEWTALDAQCRSEDDWDICRDRDRTARRLERSGLCHVRDGWRPC